MRADVSFIEIRRFCNIFWPLLPLNFASMRENRYTSPLWERGLNGSPTIKSTLWGSLSFSIHVRAAVIICARLNNVSRAFGTVFKFLILTRCLHLPHRSRNVREPGKSEHRKTCNVPAFEGPPIWLSVWGALQIQSARTMFAILNMTVLFVISYLTPFWIKVLAVCGKPGDWQRIVSFCACETIFAVCSSLYSLFEPLRIAIFANNLAWVVTWPKVVWQNLRYFLGSVQSGWSVARRDLLKKRQRPKLISQKVHQPCYWSLVRVAGQSWTD